MIEIYFDDVLVDNDYYVDIKNEFKLFDESFKLGTTTSNTFELVVPFNSIQNIPENVIIKIDNEDYATMIVDSYEIQDNNMVSLKLVDKMVLLNFNYDASSIVPCTLKNILEDICSIAGIEIGTEHFLNEDMLINFYNNTITAREYISYIAELNGGYAQIGKDGKIYLKRFDSIRSTFDISEECESVNLREKHTIERVVFDNGLLKFESSTNENLETLYLNSSNVFLNTQTAFDDIVEQILGLEFYCIETKNCIIDSNVKAGDLIKFIDGDKEYITIAQYSLDYNGCWIGNYFLNVNSQRQEETKQNGVNSTLKSIKVVLDRNENTMSQLVSTIETLEDTNENIEKSVEQLITDTYTKIEINNKLTDGSVTKIQTTNGYTFDEKGLHINTNANEFNTTHNNIGTYYKDGNSVLMQTTKDGTITKDLILYGKYYYGVDENLDVSNFKKDDAMFVSTLFKDNNNEECFGHFYNGGD